jgi:hypothetical protein
MMLISLGAMLLAWVAFIWLMDPDGARKPAHSRRWASRNRKEWRYYQEIDR